MPSHSAIDVFAADKPVAFAAQLKEFCVVSDRCAAACHAYNDLREQGTTEERVARWNAIVDTSIPSTNNNTGGVEITNDDDYDTKSRDEEHSTKDSNDSNLQCSSSDTATITPRGKRDLPFIHQVWKFSLDHFKPNSHEAELKNPEPPITDTTAIPYVKGPIYMDYGLRVKISPSTFINRNCIVLDTPVADVVIGDRCTLGPNVHLYAVGHPLAHIPPPPRPSPSPAGAGDDDLTDGITDLKLEEPTTGVPTSRSTPNSGDHETKPRQRRLAWGKGIVIQDFVWIAGDVKILGGVTVGHHSVVAADSLVTKSVPPYSLVKGSPAKVVRTIDPWSEEDNGMVLEGGEARMLGEALGMN